MNRPIRQYNGRNETTSMVDHRNEEAKINCKKQKLDQYYQTRRVNVYGSKQEQRSMQNSTASDAFLQQQIADQRKNESRSEQLQEELQINRHQAMLDDMMNERENERRQKLRSVQEQNRLASIAKTNESLYNKVTTDNNDRADTHWGLRMYRPELR